MSQDWPSGIDGFTAAGRDAVTSERRPSWRAMLVLVCGIVLALPQAAVAQSHQSGAHPARSLGKIGFTFAASPAARRHFLDGLLLLHSFGHDAARSAFRRAHAADASFRLALWGEALTYFQPVFGSSDFDSISAVLGRIPPDSKATRRTSRAESGYIAAARELARPGSPKERSAAFARALADLAKAKPAEDEAKVLYALALFGAIDIFRPSRDTMHLIATVAQQVLARNPDHPGALHYLIHSLDFPETAWLALPAARRYGGVAEDVSHAVHMPTHIYVQLGSWSDVVTHNRRAYALSSRDTLGKPAAAGDRDFHALAWVPYALTQQGRFAEARNVLRHVDSLEAASHGIPQSLVNEMFGRYAVETEDWQAADRPLSSQPSRNELLGAGLAAVHTGHLGTAEELWQTLKTSADDLMDDSKPPRPRAVKVRVAERQLRGMIDLRRGDTLAGLTALRAAVEAELNAGPAWEIPEPPKPSNELLGEALLELARPAEAANQFVFALERRTKRARSLVGLARAYAATGDTSRMRSTCDELQRQWRDADTQLRGRITPCSAPNGPQDGKAAAVSPTTAAATIPGPRNAHGIAYDLRDSALVLFGGATAHEVRGDTWLWKAGSWRQTSFRGPSPRTFPAMVYDSERGEVVLFGGNRVLFGDSIRPPVMLGDTWVWRSGAWTRMADDGPRPRAEATMAYDPVRHRTVLFGGRYQLPDGRVGRLGDTWEWDGKEWTQVSSTGPSPRSGAAMAYDPGLRAVVLFGGSGGPLGDTWSWNGREWVRMESPAVAGRFNTAMAWDPLMKRLVRFGGWDGKGRTSDTWELHQAGWVRVQEGGPSSRNHAALVSAEDRGSVLLYGGHDGDRVFADLWERRNGRWVQLESAEPVRRVTNGH